MEPDYIREDIRSELFEQLCAMPPEKVEMMHEQGYLKWYCVRAILNMAQSDQHTTFYKKYRSSGLRGMVLSSETIELQAIHDHKTENTTDTIQWQQNANKAILDAKEEMYWYDRGVWEIYEREQSVIKVAKKLGIPKTSIVGTIVKCKKLIKQKLCQYSTHLQ